MQGLSGGCDDAANNADDDGVVAMCFWSLFQLVSDNRRGRVVDSD